MSLLLQAAKQFATLHHVIRKAQMYGPLPYTHHLADVEGVLRRLGETREFMLIGAWGHDLIEDTDVKAKNIEEQFGEEVAHVVVAVTADPTLPREARMPLSYNKVRNAGPDAIRLKLADRIANMSSGGFLTKRYLKEYPDFRHALWVPDDGNHMFWIELDNVVAKLKETK